MTTEFQQTKEILDNIETSISKMNEVAYATSNENMKDKIEKNWLAIKALFILIVFGFFLGVTVASLMWFHFQLDENRFHAVSKQVDILTQRQEFLISWQKSIQDQIVILHNPQYQAP